MRPGRIELEENESRKAELRRARRKKSLHSACDNLLQSPWLRWGKRIITILLVAFLVSTATYMKRHKWRPWWVAQDPREIELLKLREATPSRAPMDAADVPSRLPMLPPGQLPSLPSEGISLTAPGSETDSLDRAARLTGQ
jgi:hypothetical protein